MSAATLAACAGLWLAPAPMLTPATAATAAMCPPSEGELDLEGYDLSGDGVVQLPEGVRWRVLPAKSDGLMGQVKQAFGAGSTGRVTLILEDPARDNRRIMTMRLTTLAAGEVQDWLGDAVGDQQKWIEAKSVAEKPGMECALDAKQCRAAANVEAGGCPHAAAQTMAKKIEMPRMYVSVTSASGQHGWSLLPASQRIAGDEPSPEAEQCWKKKCTAGTETVKKEPAASPAAGDKRITLTAYQIRDEANRPLSVKMDVSTAKKLSSDIKEALSGKTPKVLEPAIEKPASDAKGVS
jgi:hypothetical protein